MAALGTADGKSLIVPVMMSSRSGSSVVAHGVQTLGIDFGAQLRAPKAKNPLGFFEDRDVLRLSKRAHRLLAGRARLALVPDERWSSPQLAALEDEMVALLTSRFHGIERWGFKNGRILRFLPFWQRVLERLGGDVRYVFATRNPLASAESRVRGRRRKTMDRSGGVAINLYQWLCEVVPFFHRLEGKPLLVVDFDAVVAEPAGQLERLAAFLGLEWTEARARAAANFASGFLNEDLRHHRHPIAELGADPRVPAAVVTMYRWLHGLASDTVAPDDPALWASMSELSGELKVLAPLIDFAGSTEQALWRAQLNPFSPLPLLARRLGWGRDR